MLSSIVFLIFFCFPILLYSQTQLSPVILESAELEISGNTNIADFKCQLLELNSNDTISYVVDRNNNAKLFEGLEFKFGVTNFICDKSLMTTDLKASLKEKEFPHIVMKINKVTAESTYSQSGSQVVNAHITMRIAGYSEVEYIEHALLTKNKNYLTLTGTHNVLMSKFQIEPPTKLFGTVRTEDEIEIGFSIKVR